MVLGAGSHHAYALGGGSLNSSHSILLKPGSNAGRAAIKLGHVGQEHGGSIPLTAD
jgi:hypothetical protein